VETASSLDQRLGLSFSNLALLTRALTHTSYVNEHQDASEDNERLEFLGDAVLDFVVGEWVYKHFPELAEGDLTKIRSSLVKNETLAEFARQIDLGAALRLGRGEQTSGGNRRESLLGSTFEALIGAMYLDTGTLDKVKLFVKPFLESKQETVLDELNDPKSILQEWSQANKLGTPKYKITATSGPDHAKEFEMEVSIAGEVKGTGRGSSKNAAERAAAEDAIKNLGIG
jgi:ribonuclease-3